MTADLDGLEADLRAAMDWAERSVPIAGTLLHHAAHPPCYSAGHASLLAQTIAPGGHLSVRLSPARKHLTIEVSEATRSVKLRVALPRSVLSAARIAS